MTQATSAVAVWPPRLSQTGKAEAKHRSRRSDGHQTDGSQLGGWPQHTGHPHGLAIARGRVEPSRETRTRAAPRTPTAWSWVLGKALQPDSVFSLLPSRAGARRARGQQIALTYIMQHYHSATIALQSQHTHTPPPSKHHPHHLPTTPPSPCTQQPPCRRIFMCA